MKFFLYCPLGVYILTKSLIPLLEKSADPRVVSLRDTSCVCFPSSEFPTICLSYLTEVTDFKTFMNTSYYLDSAALVNVIHHLNEHLMVLGRGYLMVHCWSPR